MKNSKIIWIIIRNLTFLIVGILNTVLIAETDKGTWKNYLGYFLLALVVYDIITIIIRNRKAR